MLGLAKIQKPSIQHYKNPITPTESVKPCCNWSHKQLFSPAPAFQHVHVHSLTCFSRSRNFSVVATLSPSEHLFNQLAVHKTMHPYEQAGNASFLAKRMLQKDSSRLAHQMKAQTCFRQNIAGAVAYKMFRYIRNRSSRLPNRVWIKKAFDPSNFHPVSTGVVAPPSFLHFPTWSSRNQQINRRFCG